MGLLHLLFQGLVCSDEVWDGWIIHRISFFFLPSVARWDLRFISEQVCFVRLIYMQGSWTSKEAGIKVISAE